VSSAARRTATSVESVCSLLQRSRLLKSGQAVLQAWRRVEPRPSAGELGRFGKWLVANHYVTGYQASQLLVGQADHFFLNHYKLLDLIGSGRMAGIFKAAHNLGQIVAIKVLPKSKSQDPKVLGRFKREAKMAVRLKHPHIVRTFHLGNAAGRHYIVMEHLEGETLADVLQRRKKLPYVEAVRLIHQAIRAVQHIEEQGMVHRDLTPGNLMLVPPRPPGAPDTTLMSTLKVLDIGVGRMLFDENVKGDGESQMLTTAGTLLGSAPYMAPEQARNAHAADVRADIYSLGCVLYHMIAGQPPFTGERDFDILLRHFSEPPQPIPDPSVPAGLQTVIGTLLAKDPKERYSPQKALQALQPFLGAPDLQPEKDSSLTKSYLHWVDTQPIEEVNNAPIAPERWYYSRGGLSIGPFPTAQLAQLAVAGKLGPNDLLWMDGDNPDLAIPAKAAIDFAALAGRPQTKTAAPAPVARPPVPAPRPAPPPPPATPAEMGYDPDTGQILDQAKFTKWQKLQREKQSQTAVGGLSVSAVFEKARIHLDRWLDFDRNHRPIMAGDMEYIRKDPDIQRFMHFHARYGPDMLHKLWNHLQFMVENRRKYYCALG